MTSEFLINFCLMKVSLFFAHGMPKEGTHLFCTKANVQERESGSHDERRERIDCSLLFGRMGRQRTVTQKN
jgi:hypothetical protein